jgi:hypothetical protein
MSVSEQHERRLNPPEWLEPIAAAIDAADNFADVPAEARPLIRHSAIMAAAAHGRPPQEAHADQPVQRASHLASPGHEQLDRAILAAYASTDPDGGWSEDWAEVWTETGAGQPLPENHPLVVRRREMEEGVLGSLLRINQIR